MSDAIEKFSKQVHGGTIQRSGGSTMIIQSKHFGEVEIDASRVITFLGGLLGFHSSSRFVLLDDPHDPQIPFKWLLSVDEPDVRFLVTDPGIFFSDYVFEVLPEDQKRIGVVSEDDVSVLVLLTVPDEPKKITANLRGPLVVNWKTLIGKQLVLRDPKFTTKHYVFIQDENQLAGAAAASDEAVARGTEGLEPANGTEDVTRP